MAKTETTTLEQRMNEQKFEFVGDIRKTEQNKEKEVKNDG